MREILESAPDLAVHIRRVISVRQSALEEEVAVHSQRPAPPTAEERSSQLLLRIRKFFSL